MADALNKYSTKSDYEAATHSSGYSEVSYIADRDISVYDGCNVETTRSPNVGDAVFLDASGKKRFIRGKGFDLSKVPNTWTKVGVVVQRNGFKIRILYYTKRTIPGTSTYTYKWMNGIIHRLIPTSRSITFQARTSDAASLTSIGTFTATVDYAGNEEEFTHQVDTWLRSHQPEQVSSSLMVYNWHAEYMDWYNATTGKEEKCLAVIADSQINAKQLSDNFTTAGATENKSSCEYILASSNVMCRNGIQYNNPGVHLEQMLNQYGNASQTISSNVSPTSTTIVNLSNYTSSPYCESIRAAYSTYTDYIASRLIEWPGKRIDLPELDCRAVTSYLSQCTHVNKNGDTIISFPAANAAHLPSDNSAVNAAFDWYLGDMKITSEWYNVMTNAKSGIVDKTIIAMGGSYDPPSSQWSWTCNRRNDTAMYRIYGYGTYGYGDGEFNKMNRIYPIADYEIGS